ncbi:MAG: hypothetical protein H7A32_03875 [Deltaproteobacteria bacterium]|nr:hypothetical protein [Deltaproteobacteria bacterium]
MSISSISNSTINQTSISNLSDSTTSKASTPANQQSSAIENNEVDQQASQNLSQMTQALTDSSAPVDSSSLPTLGEIQAQQSASAQAAQQADSLDDRKIKFGSNADESTVPDRAQKILKEAMKEAGIDEVVITSTARDAEDQARAMYQLIGNKGVAGAKNLYGSNGDKVVDVYAEAKEAGKSASEIKAAMQEKIEELGASNVSNHCADHEKITVVDIGPNSSNLTAEEQQAFIEALEGDSRVSKVLHPGNSSEDAIHVEIPVE